MTRPQPQAPRASEVRKTTCYMCACRCGIDVHVTDNRVTYIEGNRDHPDQQGRPLRQGRGRDQADHLPRPPEGAAPPHRPPRLRAPSRRSPWDEALQTAVSWLKPAPRHRPRTPRLLHRPRPEPILHRLVGAGLRHAQLRGPRRLLLGQHGRGGHLHDRRRLLGIRPARLGPHPPLPPLRRGRGSRLQPHQDRHRQAQGARRPHHRREPDPHRLQRRGRRLVRHHPRHRRPPDPVPDPLPSDRRARSTLDYLAPLDERPLPRQFRP